MMFNAKTRIKAARRNACNLLNKVRLLCTDVAAASRSNYLILEPMPRAKELGNELRLTAILIANAEQHLFTAQTMIDDAGRTEA
jgi:hypothetical protein